MFIPNQTGYLSRSGGYNASGEPNFGPEIRVPCGVVKLIGQSKKTSVRADSSASRGTADEKVDQTKILFPVIVAPRIGDRFRLNGFTLRVIASHQRYAVSGELDHYECDLEHWGAS